MSKAAPRRVPRESFPRRQAAILVGVAALFRAFYWVLASKSLFLQTPVVDASFFDIWARTLADGRVFQAAVFFKPPLYAYLLSWLYRLGFSMTGVLVLQMLVGIGSVLLTYLIGRMVFSPKTAFAGALVTALLPILPFFETQLLAESWTTALTLGAVLLALRVTAGRTPRPGRSLLVAGLFLGIAALGRPNLMGLAAGFAVWMWWRGRGPGTSPFGTAALGLFLGGFLLAVSPATIHNLKYGEFTLISANLGANLVAGNSDQADGVSAIPVGVLWDDLQLRSRQAGAGRPAEASRYLTGQAVGWLAKNPGRALGLLGKKVLLLVNAREGRNNINPAWFASREGVFLLARWWPATWLVMPFAVLGLVRFRRWGPGAGLLLGTVVIQALAMLPFFVNARFRMPLLPLLALFAAAGAAVLIEQFRARDRQALAVNLGLVVALAVVVNVDWFGLGRESWLARDWFNQGLIQARAYGDREPDLDAAEQDFRRAVELAPDEVDFQERLGALLLSRAQPLVGAGMTAVQAGDWGRAVAAADRAEPLLIEARFHHQKAAEIFPRSYRSWTNLGVDAKWLGDVQVFRMQAALAEADSTAARQAALAALRYYQYSVQGYQQGIEVNGELEDSKRSINQVFGSVMSLPPLDPAIVEFQERARASARK